MSPCHRYRQLIPALTLLIGPTLFGGCAPSAEPKAPDVGISRPNVEIQPAQSAVGALEISLGGTQRICPASLLSPRHVVTAARCVQGINPSAMRVFFHDTVDVNLPSINVAGVLMHPLYEGANRAVDGLLLSELEMEQTTAFSEIVSYDIALLLLETPADGAPLELIAPQTLPETPGFSVNVTAYELRGAEELLAQRVDAEKLVLGVYPTLIHLGLSPAERGLCTSGAGTSLLAEVAQRSTLLAVGNIASCEGRGGLFTRLDVHHLFLQDGLANGLREPESYRVTLQPRDPGPGPGPGPGPDPDPDPRPDPSGCAIADGFCNQSCPEPDPDCEAPPPPPMLAPFGRACESGNDCESGVCVNDIQRNVQVCSNYCNFDSECPSGFSCRETADGMTMVCAPPTMSNPNAGDPPPELSLFGGRCMRNEDCSTSLCVTYGGAQFCSSRCSAMDPCPVRYRCERTQQGNTCVP